MKLAKLIFLISPFSVALTLLFVHPAEASVVKTTPTTAHVVPKLQKQQTLALTAPRISEQSDPLREHLGCGCSACVKSGLELQGKLPSPRNF
ncbi:hypothetical protein [Mastigocoleus sp. MO_188.B34]|uniref:hypothetical protein n=1 Tax=Mastigocoleus sp. MO_188.B34 TaxID=3036635 RepID=UPI002601B831|nr:hypothetical protein [Mastigocoleus sp. MO_188.B34]MDJ0693740.1 hypothetical protein [Mastigocoleus sp. MO_188.B34]